MKLLKFMTAGFFLIGFAGFLTCIFSFKPDFGYIEQTLVSQPDIKDIILFRSISIANTFAFVNAPIGIVFGSIFFFIQYKTAYINKYYTICIIIVIGSIILSTLYANILMPPINDIGLLPASTVQRYSVGIVAHALFLVGTYMLPMNRPIEEIR